MSMKMASLFSGIGGFEIAAENVGWQVMFHCEIDPFCNKILNYYWPKTKKYHDIKKSDFTIWRGRIDVLCGGFPCQPYSNAGKRLGKEDERHLWPEMLRAIREIQPPWVVGENVRGIVNWNGGVVFDEVQADLEAEGYEVLPFILPASGINAPHQRERVWFIAYCHGFRRDNGGDNKRARHLRTNKWTASQNKQKRGEWFRGFRAFSSNAAYRNGNGCHRRNGKNEKHADKRGQYALNNFEPIFTTANCKNKRLYRTRPTWQWRTGFKNRYFRGFFTDANVQRQKQQPGNAQPNKKGQYSRPFKAAGFDTFPTQPPVCGRNDGLPHKLDGITFSKWREGSIKGYGNAVVPELVEMIFKAIIQYQDALHFNKIN